MKTKYVISIIVIGLVISYFTIGSFVVGHNFLNPIYVLYAPGILGQLIANEGNGIICLDACGPCSSWGPWHVLVDDECKIPDRVDDCYFIDPPMEWIFVNGKCELVDKEGNLLYDGKCKEGKVELMPNSCFLLTDIVFGHANKKKEQGWKLYPGGSGWILPENSTLSPIYKEVDFGIQPLDFETMLNDKIFVDRCESNGGTWNYSYHDCEGIWEICQDVGGIVLQRNITPPCTGICLDRAIYRMSCVFEYEN